MRLDILKNTFYFYLFTWQWSLSRSSHRRCSVNNDGLRNYANFTGKHLCWSLFLIQLEIWRPVTLLNKDSNTGVFLWNLRNFKAPISKSIGKWLLVPLYTNWTHQKIYRLVVIDNLYQWCCSLLPLLAITSFAVLFGCYKKSFIISLKTFELRKTTARYTYI